MMDPFNYGQDLPEAFLHRMAEMLGSEYNDFLTSLHHPAITGLRVNTLKLSPEEFVHRSPYKLSAVQWCSTGYIVELENEGTGSISPGKHPYHRAGLYYVQEPSAMAAAEALSPQPGEKVLDLAAAPGGKATHLAALMKNTGLLVANEIHPKRVWDLAENLERCGVINAIVTNESPQRLADRFEGYFDRVMLDAPCSGEGMFRKGEVAIKEWKPESVRSCAIRQAAILEQAARMVKPGGYLAYTTCTFSPEENEGVIAGFIARHSEYDLRTFHQFPGYQPAKPEWIGLSPDHKINRAIRLWPHLSQGEGHFIALIVKHGTSEKDQKNVGNPPEYLSKRYVKKEIMNIARVWFDDFCTDNLALSMDDARLVKEGSYLYHLPEGTPDLTGLKVIHPGWWLGTLHKERFIPSHSLAMGIRSDQAKHILQLHVGDQRLSAYLAGESLPDSGDNGWVLVTVDGFPVGWGKRVQNVIKNFYPHGLRRVA